MFSRLQEQVSGICFNVLNKYPTLGPVGGESLEMESRISLPEGPSVGYLLRFSKHCPTIGSVSGESLEAGSRISPPTGPSVWYLSQCSINTRHLAL